MKKLKRLGLFLVLSIFAFGISMLYMQKRDLDTIATSLANGHRVIDQVGVFTDTERAKLDAKTKNLHDAFNFSSSVLTGTSAMPKGYFTFLAKYSDHMAYLYPAEGNDAYHLVVYFSTHDDAGVAQLKVFRLAKTLAKASVATVVGNQLDAISQHLTATQNELETEQQNVSQ